MKLLVVWILILLIMVVWQDFRYRGVSWYLFPLLLLSLAANSWFTGSLHIMEWLLNVLLITIQLLLLQVFCFIRYGRWLMADERYLGWGDILFFLVLTFGFSCMNFLLFNLLSFVFILLVTLLYRVLGGRSTQIPLAGGQALALAVLLALNFQNNGKNLFMDDYLIRWLPWM